MTKLKILRKEKNSRLKKWLKYSESVRAWCTRSNEAHDVQELIPLLNCQNCLI